MLLGKQDQCLTFVQVQKLLAIDACFGPFHSVILKKDGSILSNKKVLQIPSSQGVVTTIDTTCNREKCNFGIAVTSTKNVFKWKISSELPCIEQLPVSKPVTNVSCGKENVIMSVIK